MISKGLALFLIVATTVSGRILHRPKSHAENLVLLPRLSSGCPSALEPAPLICKFMLPEEYQYKPPLFAPSTYIPPLVVEKCDTPQLDIDIPAPMKPIVIPEAPILPPITIPKFPVPVIAQKPLPVQPYEPAFMPEVIPVPLPPMHVMPEIQAEPCLDEVVPKIPIVVPQPPELPAFVMPELPKMEVLEYIAPQPIEPAFIPEPVMNLPVAPELPLFETPALPEIITQPEPCLDEVVFPEIPYKPVVIPQAPELPAFVMPELPVRVEVPAPEPCLDDQLFPIAPVPEYIPSPMPLPIEPVFAPQVPHMDIPAAPALPPFEMPTLPIVAPKPYNEVILPEIPYKPVVVPQAPELPAFVMPELPVRVESFPNVEPCLEEQIIPVAPAYPEYVPLPIPMPLPEAPKPIVVPQAPKLPAFVMPEFPVRIEQPMIAPCPEDLLPFVPQHIHPMAFPVPELPKALPHIPVHVMSNPEDPCLTDEAAFMVPHLPKLPEPIAMPIMPAYGPALVDPCEPFAKSAVKSELPPYFVGHPAHAGMPMNFGFYNHPAMGAVQLMRHFK